MANKTLSLISLSILALLVLTSFASAAITITAPTDSEFSQTTGNTLTINYTGATISNTLTATFSAVTDETGKAITFATTLTSTPLIATAGSFDVTTTIPAGFDFSVDTKATTLTLTENTTPTTSATQVLTFAKTEFCAWDGNNYTNLNNDLTVEIKDITVTKGYGEDYEWFPFDEVEVELKVENNNNDDDIKDVVVEWGIFDESTGKWTLDVADEDDFTLKDGTDKTILLTFKVDDFDEDFDEIGSDLLFYVRARGKVDDAVTDYNACASDSEVVKMVVEDSFVVLSDIVSTETSTCGSQVQLTANVWNVGDEEQEGVYVSIYNKELGISETVTLGDIDSFDNAKLDTIVEVPQDAVEKSYVLTLSVYNDDNEVFQNDFDDEEAVYSVQLKVAGSCNYVTPVSVGAVLESEAKAGQELSVQATITNTDTKAGTFVVSVEDYAEWAELASVDKSTLELSAGESAVVAIKFNVGAEASGEQSFNIVAKQGEKVLSQPVSVKLAEASVFPSLTGLFTGEGNSAYLWGIGALNVILVVVIIVVAVKVMKKNSK